MKKEIFGITAVSLILLVLAVLFIFIVGTIGFLSIAQKTKTFEYKGLPVKATSSTSFNSKSSCGGQITWAATLSNDENQINGKTKMSTSGCSGGVPSPSLQLEIQLPDLNKVSNVFVQLNGKIQSSVRASSSYSIVFGDKSNKITLQSESVPTTGTFTQKNLGSVFFKIDNQGFITTSSGTAARLKDFDTDKVFIFISSSSNSPDSRNSGSVDFTIEDIDLTFKELPKPKTEAEEIAQVIEAFEDSDKLTEESENAIEELSDNVEMKDDSIEFVDNNKKSVLQRIIDWFLGWFK